MWIKIRLYKIVHNFAGRMFIGAGVGMGIII